MDKTKYGNGIMVMTYSALAYCWAGKALLPHTDMLICGISGLILGLVTVYIEKIFSCPTYIARGVGAFFRALLIIEIRVFTGIVETDEMTIIGSMIPAVAAGAMLVEGLCTSSSQQGRKKIINAVLISAFLALGVFLALMLSKWRGLPVCI